MQLEQVATRGMTELSRITGLQASTVVGISPDEDGWQLTIELIEKESIPRGMDILGVYRINVDGTGSLLKFERVGLRRRADVPV